MKDLPSAANLRQSFEAAALQIVLTLGPMKKIPQSVLQQALMGGVLLLAGYLVIYLISPEAIMGGWASLFVLATVVVVMVKSLLAVRKEEGELKFGRAFGLALVAGSLARLGYNLFNVILFGLLRPDLVDAYVDLVMNKTEEAIASLGMDLSAVGVNLSEIGDQLRWTLTPVGQLVDWFQSIILLAILALIVAAFLKRNVESNQFEG